MAPARSAAAGIPPAHDRAAAEANRQLAADEHDRRGTGRSRLTLGDHIGRAWLPRKQRQLRLYILSPALGHLPLRSLRVEQIETLYEPATDLRTA